MISSITLLPNNFDPEKIEVIESQMIASMKNESGLLSIRGSKGSLMSPGGPPSYEKVFESQWESLESFMTWVQKQTPEDQANKDFMIENGAVFLFYEVEELT